MFAILFAAGGVRPEQDNGQQAAALTLPAFRASALAELVDSSGSTGKLGYAFPAAQRLLLPNPVQDSPGLTAFEENATFAYAAVAIPGPGGGPDTFAGRTTSPRLLRRVIYLRPSTFILDDELVTTRATGPVTWQLESQRVVDLKGRKAHLREGLSWLLVERLLPAVGSWRVERGATGGLMTERLSVETVAPMSTGRIRFLHVLFVGEPGREGPAIRTELAVNDRQVQMTISSKSRVFRLELPSLEVDAGRIAVGPLGGTPLLDSRPFPSGILPHDPDGIRLLEQWDADYRGKKPPPWDIGKPAKELKELVDEKRVLPSRVIDLCCGTGTDAIFLARRGFDVTAVDISPTALAQAQQKAQQAGVPVRWVLADVLAAPRLEPFDFIYDRGCYHVVRDQNLPAYLEAVRRLSRPGSQFLLLAARRELASRDDGPAGVTEEELRFDFLSLFDIEWLRETRLEANRPGGMGPPSWAALLTRRADVNPVR